MSRFLLHCAIAASVGFTAGCAAARTSPDIAPFSTYALHYTDMGDRIKLAYGQANSDNLGLMMECDKGSSRVELSDVARGGKAQIVLASNGARSDFGASLGDGPTPVLMADARIDTPALAAFRKTGDMAVTAGSSRYRVRADEAQKADIERFFKACERA